MRLNKDTSLLPWVVFLANRSGLTSFICRRYRSGCLLLWIGAFALHILTEDLKLRGGFALFPYKREPRARQKVDQPGHIKALCMPPARFLFGVREGGLLLSARFSSSKIRKEIHLVISGQAPPGHLSSPPPWGYPSPKEAPPGHLFLSSTVNGLRRSLRSGQLGW